MSAPNSPGVDASHVLRRWLVTLLAVAAVMVLSGLLVVHVLAHGLLAGEDSVNRDLVPDRTSTWNTVTSALSTVANTFEVIGATALVALVLRLTLHRWRESLFVVAAVAGQSAVFLVTTLLVHRQRPHVPRLDDSPPTSSFPSGHTGASTALWLAVAVVLVRLIDRRWLQVLVVVAALAVPTAVGVARLYRGMHHPSDVALGATNGVLCVTAAGRSILPGDERRRRAGAAAAVRSGPAARPEAVR